MIKTAAPPVAAVVLISLAIITASEGLLASAQVDPVVSVDAIIDDNGDTTPDNGATSVGDVDPCISVAPGAIFDLDMVIEQEAGQELSGFQANLIYDPLILQVNGVDYGFLLGSTGESIWDVGDSTPDSDGNFLLAAATVINTIGGSYASGSGVLARLTVETLSSGTSQLDLTNVKLADGNSNPIQPSDANNFYVGPINDGSAAVDTSCGPIPTPIPTPTPTPSPCPGDSDCDGVLDGSDNCPDVANGSAEAGVPGVGNQINTDQDLGNNGATFDGVNTGDGDGDACDLDDDDDGYTDIAEDDIGTATNDNCTNTSGPGPGPNADAFPSDMNKDDVVAINDVTGPFSPHFGAVEGVDPTGTNPGDYNPRVDLNNDGIVAINDITGPFAPDFGKGCT